jgi:prepilin-type N-terminal cleavage/methylation domain-containing protein
MRLKKKNKGFSLVELIVVMAIMAILAVTLAPTLTQYVEKSRKAADREVINSIYTAAQYALLDEKLNSAATALIPSGGLSLNADIVTTPTATQYYLVTGKAWVVNPAVSGATSPNAFISEIYNVIGNFKLKSTEADASSDIEISYSGGVLTVLLKYDRGTSDANADYTVSSNDVR